MARYEGKMTCSCGICTIPMGASDKRQLVNNADLALYNAKRNEKNCTRTYSEGPVQDASDGIRDENTGIFKPYVYVRCKNNDQEIIMTNEFEEYLTFHITSKDGATVEMAVLDEFDFEQRHYVVSAVVKGDTMDEEGLYIYRALIKDDDFTVEKIEKEFEYNRIAKAYLAMEKDPDFTSAPRHPAKKDITVIGSAIMDVLTSPVSPQIFHTGSQPVKMTKLSFGGDALNESIVLSRFGKRVELVSKVGEDEAGAQIINYIRENGLSPDSVKVESGLQTGINIVLIDGDGERYFLTNPHGSLRKLAEADIKPYLNQAADIVSFASIFVSPLLDLPAMERIFKQIKTKPERILAADMTRAKNGERLEDLKKLLPYIDYIFPNETEIALLTGIKDPFKNAELLVNNGVSCAVIKRGAQGCLIRTRKEIYQIPAYPAAHPVDTTGAGDAFTAGFLWGLSQKFQLEDCGLWKELGRQMVSAH